MLKEKNKASQKEQKSFVINYPHETRVYSFTPRTNRSTKRSQTPRWRQLYEDSVKRNEKRDRSYIEKIVSVNHKNMKQCTFSPKISK